MTVLPKSKPIPGDALAIEAAAYKLLSFAVFEGFAQVVIQSNHSGCIVRDDGTREQVCPTGHERLLHVLGNLGRLIESDGTVVLSFHYTVLFVPQLIVDIEREGVQGTLRWLWI